ncbi:hypothetical protein [Thermosulfidibacter takaii]|nr:hypothetical protein [Thermosulfidibacter takaii]
MSIWKLSKFKLACFQKQKEYVDAALARSSIIKKELTQLKQVLSIKNRYCFNSKENAYRALLELLDDVSQKDYVKKATLTPRPNYVTWTNTHTLNISFDDFSWSDLGDLLNAVLKKKGFIFTFKSLKIKGKSATLRLTTETCVRRKGA